MADWIKAVIQNLSYPGIAFLMILENVFPPIPSELIMPLAGYVSSQGELSILGVIAAGTVGSVAGAVVLYYLGHRVGGERLRRWADARGRWIGLTRADLDKSDRWFARHGAKIVLLGRLVPGVRSLISIPAGIAGMNMRVFLAYTTIGSLAWTTVLTLAGRALGRNYERVEHVISPVSTAVVVAIVATLVVRALRQGRRVPAAKTNRLCCDGF